MFAMNLVHAGAQGAGGGLALVANMGMAANYSVLEQLPGPPPVEAAIRLTIKRNGQWEITQSIGISGVSGSPLSGNWGSPNNPLAGDDYEARIVENSGSGGAITNQLVAWTRLTSDKYFEIIASDSSLNDSPVVGSRNITITVRRFGTTTPVSTNTTGFTAAADYSNL